MSAKRLFFLYACIATLFAGFLLYDNYKLHKENAFLQGWTQEQRYTIDSLYLQISMHR